MKKIIDTENIPMGFHFDEENHLYFFDQKPLSGVTSVLNVIAKPALIAWASNENTKTLKEKAIIDDKGNLIISPELLEEARTAHAKRKDKAAKQGTDIHSKLENIIKKAINENSGLINGHELNEEPQVSKFVDWALENKVKFFESEKKLYSPTYWLAGTCDFTCEIEGRRYVGDIKTTSGIYDLTPFMQIGAYRLMLEEMGEKEFVGGVIVRLGKDGSFEVKERLHAENGDGQSFLHALVLYRAMEDFKNIKQLTIKVK